MDWSRSLVSVGGYRTVNVWYTHQVLRPHKSRVCAGYLGPMPRHDDHVPCLQTTVALPETELLCLVLEAGTVTISQRDDSGSVVKVHGWIKETVRVRPSSRECSMYTG